MSQLRALDRKVLREDRRRTPEQWRRQMRRWWWPLAVLALLGLAGAVLLDEWSVGVAVLPSFMVLAFQCGRMKAEHDRLEGRDPWWRVRPLQDG